MYHFKQQRFSFHNTNSHTPTHTHRFRLLSLSCRLNVNSPDVHPCFQPMVTSQLINPNSINMNCFDMMCAFKPPVSVCLHEGKRETNQKGGPVFT